jgi:poly-gamma-glutamate system protein
MPPRTGLIGLPRWVQTAAGLALTAGLAVLATGRVALPRWLVPREAAAVADADRAGAEATRRWEDARGEIARARGVAESEALVGHELTPLVTTLGEIEAKRVSASAAWARVLVRELRRAGVRSGDVVAASFSGSFPGINLAVMTACQALGARLVAISSVTASSWGATDPGFTWPEIEARLVAAGLLHGATVAVSIGGEGDRGLDLDDEGRALARGIAARCSRQLGATLIEPATFGEAVGIRLAAYDAARGTKPLAAFVNVGGTQASLGLSTAILRVRNGWLGPEPFDASPGRGLIARMVERGVPVLHVLNVRDLAFRWGIL